MEGEEFNKATHYVMSNTPEFDVYFEEFEKSIRQDQPHLDDHGIYCATLNTFPAWVKNHVWSLGNTQGICEWIHQLSMGLYWNVSCTAAYKVNNYKFHIESHGAGRKIVNSHVYVKGTEGVHYYGVIEEIIHMRCHMNHGLKVVLFKFRWFDPKYVKTYPAHGITQVNKSRLYAHYDPFILAQQAVQVYYTEFPGLPAQTDEGWVAICHVKPTNTIDMSIVDSPFQEDVAPPNEMPCVPELSQFPVLADDIDYDYNLGTHIETESPESSPNVNSQDD